MSVRAAGTLLFAAAVFMVPLPLLGLEGSLIPVARYLQLAAVALELLVAEGSAGRVGTLLALLAGHAAVYALLLAVATWLFARFGLARLPSRARALVAIVLVAALAGIASIGRVYDTQFHHASAHARLLELYR